MSLIFAKPWRVQRCTKALRSHGEEAVMSDVEERLGRMTGDKLIAFIVLEDAEAFVSATAQADQGGAWEGRGRGEMSDHQIAALLCALPCLTLAAAWLVGTACLNAQTVRVRRRVP
jgi:predicted GNAT family acetyltransferase